MRKLIINKGERAASHHNYIYEDGKKTEIPNDGVVFLYKDKYGLLHASEWEDIAAESGKYVMTDEVYAHEGLPFLNNSVYTVWGAGPCYVYLAKTREDKFYTPDKVIHDRKVIITKGNEVKKNDCELLRQLYLMLGESEENE